MSIDKKTIIYEAALSLVYENNDLSRIKVADIAERANIGKGTVYEYFNSKEQVIGEALIFIFKKTIESVQMLIDEDKGFKETFTLLLYQLGKMMTNNKNLHNFLTVNHKNIAVHTAIQNLLRTQFDELRQEYLQLVERLVDKSVQEGIIKDKPDRFDWQVAVMSSMTCIFVHKQFEEEFSYLGNAEVLEKAYNAYIKQLSN